MRLLLPLLLCVLVPTVLLAEDDPPPPPVFPVTFEGTWKGACDLIRGSAPVTTFPMELHVKRLEREGCWTWHVVYGAGDARQLRPYLLRPVVGEPLHFRVDETNGVLIDAYLENEALHSRFRVGGNVTEATYARTGDRLAVTLTTFGAEPASTTGGQDGVPPVESFPLRGIQRGVLERVP